MTRLPLSPRRAASLFVAALATVALIGLVSSIMSLSVPTPSGSSAVGRMQVAWVDASRPESRTASLDDRRVVAVQIWFPATADTGHRAPYIEDLARLEDGLLASSEFNRFQLWGLSQVRDNTRAGAWLPAASDRFSVVLFSPGNATNVSFYSTIAEELASHGFVVVGVDHPFQVAAVAVPDGSVAVYDASADALAPPERVASLNARVEERVADVRFVIDQLEQLNATEFQARMDLGQVGVAGHSNGGLTAAEVCRRDARVKACLNIDGQQEGGPFGVAVDAEAPEQPFMFLTKETFLHPEIGRRFENAGEGVYRVVIPAATHQQFSDAPLFQPTLLPFSRPAERVLVVARGFTRAFFEHHLRDAPRAVLANVPAPTDVFVNVYPLGENPPLPRT